MADLLALIAELTSEDDLRAEQALQHLATIGQAALDPLLALLNSGNPDHRWWATTALAGIEHPDTQTGLVRALDDPDMAVRQAAAAGVRQAPFPEAIPALIRNLGNSDRLLARLASGALAAIGIPAISPLTISLRSEDPAVRIEAVRALAEIDDPSVVPVLFAALSDPSVVVVHLAEQGLNRQGVGMVFFEL